MAVIVCGLAFLVASAPAHNSDLWLHLAAGRDLLAGRYHFGADPFAQDTQGVYWANTNWLYDAATYLVFRAAGGLDGWGGAALVLLKALLTTALAAVLLALARCGRDLWVPAVGAAWALVALCPWLAPHPMVVSYLFLALTLLFLERPHRRAGDGPVPVTAYWPLLPLFVLWANIDAWFLLGPATVALYLIGEALQAAFGPDRGAAVRPGIVRALAVALPVSLAACLANPHHVYAFLSPPAQLGLSPAARVLRDDSAFQGLLLSPFQPSYMHAGGPGWNPAGWAYVSLVLAGALSFVFNAAGLRWRRLLAWAALFALSAFQVRAVPFFAVAAGPLLALNVQEGLARRAGEWARGSQGRRWAAAGRAASLLAGLALLVVAWPGWLHAAPCEPPRWDVEVDEGLRRAAAQLADLRRDGRLGADGFDVSADAANYFAWFCPDEKGVMDARLPLFPAAAAADLVAVRKALSDPGEWTTPEEASREEVREVLAPENGADPATFGGPPMEAVRAILRRRGADRLIVYDNDPQKALTWSARLMRYPREWQLIALGGRAAVFAWRDPAAGGSSRADAAWDLTRRAFDPPLEARAPQRGPDREPDPPGWAETFTALARPRPSGRADEAEFFLRCFDQEATPGALLFGYSRYGFRTRVAWDDALAGGVVGLASCAGGSVAAPYEMTLRLQVLTGGGAGPAGRPEEYKPTAAEQLAARFRQDYAARHDDGPPGLLYLALRAARLAVRDDPDDGRAYLLLGEVYRRLLQNTTERTWNPPRVLWDRQPDPHPPASQLLYKVRTAEAVAAYRRALQANPDLEAAHMGLISLYQELDFQDEVLNELKEVLRCNRLAGRRPGEDIKQFNDRIRDLEDLVDHKARDVRGQLDRFEVKTASAPVYLKARMAWHDFGLGGKALAVLLASDVSEFGEDGEELELDLLLHTGRLKEVRDWPDPEKAKGFLGAQRYLALQVQLEAASGNYQRADDDLAEMLEGQTSVAGAGGEPIPTRAAVALAVGHEVLTSRPTEGLPSYLFRAGLELPLTVKVSVDQLAGLTREADLSTVRAALNLEAGETAKARGQFEDALSVWGGERQAAAGAGLDFPARPIAQSDLGMMEKSGR